MAFFFGSYALGFIIGVKWPLRLLLRLGPLTVREVGETMEKLDAAGDKQL